MDEALILGKISYRVPKNIIEQFKKIDGVSEVNLIFGPYDFYALVETETKEMLSNIALNIRSIKGVIDTLTCYVVDFSDIRPEARGPFAE